MRTVTHLNVRCPLSIFTTRCSSHINTKWSITAQSMCSRKIVEKIHSFSVIINIMIDIHKRVPRRTANFLFIELLKKGKKSFLLFKNKRMNFFFSLLLFSHHNLLLQFAGSQVVTVLVKNLFDLGCVDRFCLDCEMVILNLNFWT